MNGGRIVGVAAAGVLFGLILAAGIWNVITATPAADPDAPAVEVRVEPGEGFASVARRLEDEGLVVSATRVRLLARLTGAHRNVRAGTYTFVRGTSPLALLDDLVAGRVRQLRFTVPEGWRLEQIAAGAESGLGVPAAELIAAASDDALRERLECPAENLEGYLFPETYFFPDGIDARSIVQAMTARFEEVWASLEGEPPAGVTRHGVVTLASIVEAETPLPEERSRVAAVYLNRLEKNWRLEADPTVRYALGKFTGRLYYKHLDVESPYNTYRNAGLPPGPIGAPGRGALQAVLDPLTPCDDFYFVASGDGGHVFSRTKAEHDRARRIARGASR